MVGRLEETIGPLLGEGKVAEAFAYGDDVLKLYRAGRSKDAAFFEASVLSALEPFQLPAPRVLRVDRFDGRWGLVMTRAGGRPFAEAMLAQPEQLATHLDTMVVLQRQIHACAVPAFASLKLRLEARIIRAPGLREVVRRRLLDRLAALPDGGRLCHGDFHPFNVMGGPESASVVDWLDATRGEPAADVCRSYLLMRHHSEPLAADYVGRYATAAGMGTDEVFAWLAVMAAARLDEDVPEEAEVLIALAEAV